MNQVFKDYHELIVKTAQYPEALKGRECGRYYVALGLVSEWGEVAGKVKKLNRGDYDNRHDEWLTAIRQEFGGFFWYVWATLAEYDLKITPQPPPCGKQFVLGSAGLTEAAKRELERDVLALSHKLNKWLDEPQRGTFLQMVTFAMRVALMLGFTIEEIITENTAILTSRLERDVIKGEGDTR